MSKKIEKTFITFTIIWFFIFVLCPLFSNSAVNNRTVEIDEVIPIDTITVIDMDDEFEITEMEIEFASYPYKISNEGKEFIKSHESLKLIAYDDPTPQKRSIGWGHQIQPGENYTKITETKANELFDNDIKKVEAAVNRLLKKTNPNFKYTQGFIDGMCSLVYNCGEYGVSQTPFYQRLLKCRADNSLDNINESDLNFTLAAVKTSKVFCSGHKVRRQNEYEMMIN